MNREELLAERETLLTELATVGNDSRQIQAHAKATERAAFGALQKVRTANAIAISKARRAVLGKQYAIDAIDKKVAELDRVEAAKQARIAALFGPQLDTAPDCEASHA